MIWRQGGPVYGFGIDPGYRNCGWAVVRENGGLARVASGTIRTPPKSGLEASVEIIARALSAAWADVPSDGPLRVAIERFIPGGRAATSIVVEGTLLVVGTARTLFRPRARLVSTSRWHSMLKTKGRDEDDVLRVVESSLGLLPRSVRGAHEIDALALAMVALREDELPYE